MHSLSLLCLSLQVHTGWYAKHHGNPKEYWGTDNAAHLEQLSFPGVKPDVSRFLVEERNINGQWKHLSCHLILIEKLCVNPYSVTHFTWRHRFPIRWVNVTWAYSYNKDYTVIYALNLGMSHGKAIYIARRHPWYSCSTLDCWPTGRAIDPAPRARFITKFISLAQVVSGPV